MSVSAAGAKSSVCRVTQDGSTLRRHHASHPSIWSSTPRHRAGSISPTFLISLALSTQRNHRNSSNRQTNVGLNPAFQFLLERLPKNLFTTILGFPDIS